MDGKAFATRFTPKRWTRTAACFAAAALVAAGGLAAVNAQEDETNDPAVAYTAVVVDAANGEPVAGARVFLDGQGDATSGADGQVSFAVEEGSAWRAGVTAEGYADTTGMAHNGSSVDVIETIGLYEKEPTAGAPAGDAADGAAEVPGSESAVGDVPAAGAGAESSTSAEDEAAQQPSDGAEDPSASAGEETKPGQGDGTDEAPAEDKPVADKPVADKPASDAPAAQVPVEVVPPNPSESAIASGAQENGGYVESSEEDYVETSAPPAWALSGNTALVGNLGMAEEMRLLEKELTSHIDMMRKELAVPEDAVVSYDMDNTADIWAVYAAASGMEQNFPYKVELSTSTERDRLRSVFWSMTSVSASVSKVNGKDVSVVQVERKTYKDMVEQMGLADMSEQLASMTGASAREAVAKSSAESVLSKLSDEEFSKIEESLEGIEGQRRAVVLAALSLEGKVNYFYGGKSHGVGWNDAWGQIAQVSGDETLSGGSVEAYGLDCSGFISWSFINAAGTVDQLSYIGEGTTAQWGNTKEVAMADAKPGDLVFLAGPSSVGANNHVGIVVKNDHGNLTVVHCSGSADNVVVTDASMFSYARIPYAYGEAA